MDWRTVDFDWNRARAFLVTAEEGSFSAAARALGSTQPTIGRQVSQLEEELGVALFQRVGTRLELTGTGLELVEHVRMMGEAATRLSLTAAGQSTSIEGTVAITASEAISAYLLPPVLKAIRLEHPGIDVEIVASNEIRDLQRREADIAIRNVPPTQSDLVGRKVADSLAYLYASPEYIDRCGPFDRPEDLARAEFFAFDQTEVMINGLNAMGAPVARENFPITTGSHLVQWEMCKQGLGICVMMSAVGDREPSVRQIVPEVAIPVPLWLASHRELRTNRRIRLVFDALADALGATE